MLRPAPLPTPAPSRLFSRATHPILLQLEADKFPLKEGPPPVLTAADVLTAAREKPLKSILVTGSTGYVGAFVVEALAKHVRVDTVFCVIRAKDAEKARARLLSTCEKRGLLIGDTSWLDRVVCVPGDVSETQLGLSPSDHLLMIGKTDVVVHCGAEVNMIKPYTVLAKPNVGGTANVLDFAARAGAPHVFTSTILPMEGEETTGYRRSKEVAEVLTLRAHSSHAIPSAVLQLGDIGLSERPNARLPDDDFLVITLRACMRLGLFPEADWAVSVMSIDQCAAKISRLALDSPAEAFTAIPEEVKGKLIPWHQLFEWVHEELGLKMCSYEGWSNAIKAFADDGEVAMQRMLIMLPAISAESEAEAKRMHSGEGIDVELAVDGAWGLNLARALSTERAKLAAEAIDPPPLSRSWAALAPAESLVPLSIALPTLGTHDVEITVSHTALSAADLDLIDGKHAGDAPSFPRVSGGQLVGQVAALGDGVRRLRIGDRVGLGWVKQSCLNCRLCLGGKEHLCPEVVRTCCGAQRGGLTEKYRADSRFVHQIPEQLGSAEAAPLLSTGLVAFCALQHAQPGDAVGVLGVGGLGHLALQIAARRGCTVTAISSNQAKEPLAKELGATHFILSSAAVKAEPGSLDFLLVCSTMAYDPAIVARLLAPEGAVCFVPGGAAASASLDLQQMAHRGQRVLTASAGGRLDMQAFLRFATAHGIRACVETVPISDVNHGVSMLRANEAQFCVVVEAD